MTEFSIYAMSFATATASVPSVLAGGGGGESDAEIARRLGIPLTPTHAVGTDAGSGAAAAAAPAVDPMQHGIAIATREYFFKL